MDKIKVKRSVIYGDGDKARSIAKIGIISAWSVRAMGCTQRIQLIRIMKR